MEPEDSNFPNRIGQGTDARAKYVKRLVDRLIEMQEQTDPSRGADSEHRKDHVAFMALMTAGDLVKALAGCPPARKQHCGGLEDV